MNWFIRSNGTIPICSIYRQLLLQKEDGLIKGFRNQQRCVIKNGESTLLNKSTRRNAVVMKDKIF
jgi:hypothetical protein